MKVCITESKWCDVYFKTEGSAKQFINYLSTVTGKEFQLYESRTFSGVMRKRGVIYVYLYTLSNYVEPCVVDSYLELFPEEKE